MESIFVSGVFPLINYKKKRVFKQRMTPSKSQMLSFVLLALLALKLQISESLSINHVAFFSEDYCGLILTLDGIPGETQEILQSHVNLQRFESIVSYEKVSRPLEFGSENSLKTFQNGHPHREQSQRIPKNSNQALASEWSVTIIYFSRFYDIDNLEVSLVLKEPKSTEPETQKLIFSSSKKESLDGSEWVQLDLKLPLNQSIVIEKYKKIIPQTVQEALAYHKNFQSIMLERNLSFYQEPIEKVSHIITIQRAGTHLVSRLLEDILGEWVSMFPLQESKTFVNLDQLKGYPTEHCRISTSHSIIDNQEKRFSLRVDRYVFLVRDILDASDSLYHKRRLVDHEAKFQGEYWLTEDFSYFFYKLLPDFERKAGIYIPLDYPKITVRYEDLMASPHQVTESLLSFILLYPARHAILPKIKEVLETQGLRSYYKTTTTANSTEVEGSQPEEQKEFSNLKKEKKDRTEMFKLEMIKRVWESSRKYLGFFDYEEKIRNKLGQQRRWMEETFREDNTRNMEKMLMKSGFTRK